MKIFQNTQKSWFSNGLAKDSNQICSLGYGSSIMYHLGHEPVALVFVSIGEHSSSCQESSKVYILMAATLDFHMPYPVRG
ncbi:unnamed protein product [Caenorhabditis brenneri]